MSATQDTVGTKLRRVQIREVLRRHEGSIGSVAKDVGVTIQSVSQWLAGRMKSQKIAEASERRALALLEQEAASKKAGAA